MASRKPTVRRRRPRGDFSKAVQLAIAKFDADTKGGEVAVPRVIDLIGELTQAVTVEAGETGRDIVHNGIDDVIDAAATKGKAWLKNTVAGVIAKRSG